MQFFYSVIHHHPCMRSPCGPYSQCHAVEDHAICACLSGYFGTPPNCHPECVSNADCPLDKSCVNQICSNPCPGVCGYNARCHVVNHNPICSCNAGYSGDPFVRCVEQISKHSRSQLCAQNVDEKFNRIIQIVLKRNQFHRIPISMAGP